MIISTGESGLVRGSLPVSNGCSFNSLPAGPDTYVLTADSTQPYGIAWEGVNPGASTYALQFSGQATPMQVYHGGFWPASVNLTGGFFWDLWVKPQTPAIQNNGYLISDGWGGAHALLFGLNQQPGSTTLQVLQGNVYTGTNTVSYTADDGLYPGEWGHVAVCWDSANGFLYVYIDGIPCMRQAFSGPRQSPTTVNNGGNDLNIGGSNHSNFNGCIAACRGFEGTCVLGFASPGEYAFAPQWPLPPWSFLNSGSWTACNFLADYTVPGRRLVPDLAPYGYVDGSGSPRTHPGFLWGSNTAAGGNIGRWAGPSSYPIPQYVNDPTFPFPQLGAPPTPPAAGVPAKAPVPTGARVFDLYAGKGVAEGKKSIAIAVTLQPVERTLTDAEIEAVSAKIVAQVAKATGAVLRG